MPIIDIDIDIDNGKGKGKGKCYDELLINKDTFDVKEFMDDVCHVQFYSPMQCSRVEISSSVNVNGRCIQEYQS